MIPWAGRFSGCVLKKHPENLPAQGIIRDIEKKERAKAGAQVYGEAVAMIRLGMFNDAQEKIKQSIELDPGNKEYASIYETVKAQAERDQKSEAEKLLAKI